VHFRFTKRNPSPGALLFRSTEDPGKEFSVKLGEGEICNVCMERTEWFMASDSLINLERQVNLLWIDRWFSEITSEFLYVCYDHGVMSCGRRALVSGPFRAGKISCDTKRERMSYGVWEGVQRRK
jgi:hypothetical protein